MINLLKIAQKLDQKGQYKAADKLTKSASILLMAIQTKQDLEDGIRALYNYFDERTLTKILKQTNILEKDGDISSRPFDYNELMNVLNNIETTSPADLPTRSGNNNYNNLEEVKQKILQTIKCKFLYQMHMMFKENNKRKYKIYKMMSFPTNDKSLQQNIKQRIIKL